MTIYLRNSKRDTLFDLEVWEKDKKFDLRASIPIRAYSDLLLANPDKQEYIIDSFEIVQQLRGWYWEIYNEQNPNHSFQDLITAVTEILILIRSELNLYIVTD